MKENNDEDENETILQYEATVGLIVRGQRAQNRHVCPYWPK